MEKLRVGLIGAGFIARTHIDALRRACLLFPELGVEVELPVVADATLATARSFASRTGIAGATDDWRAVVEDPAIDLVDIATPNNLHFPIAMAAIEAGKAIYCEKPLALSAAEAGRMAAAAEARGVTTFVAFNNLWAPATQLARAIVARGDIGEPVQFTGSFDQGFYSDRELPASWRTRRAEAGSGALGDLGSHAISIAQYLVGRVASVAAMEAVVFGDRPVPAAGMGYGAKAGAGEARQPVENDDLVQALVRFDGGAIGAIGASRVAPGRVFGINWELRGTDGTLYLENERSNELHLFRMADARDDRGFKTIHCGSQVDGFREGFFGFDYGGGGIGYFDVKVLEIRALLTSLTQHREAFCGFRFGYENQLVVDAIHASAAAGGAMTAVERGQ
jgi:predicted dehydrogenase